MNYRFLARIILESTTPLQMGSGEKDISTDQLVVLDVNQLPYIPGTSLAGVLRNNLSSKLSDEEIKSILGFQGKREDDSEGSRLVISSANMIGAEGKVIDGLQAIEFSAPFYNWFRDLPVRQHVRISDKGSAEKSGKFDNQVVFKGTRFCFELEMISEDTHKDLILWEKLISEFHSRKFRLGGGTRKGYGEVKVIEIKHTSLDLTKELDVYLDKTSNLDDPFWNEIKPDSDARETTEKIISYRLELKPDDFFLFSSGLESQNADITYVVEPVIEWKNGIPEFSEKEILIPASSVKGAISHRVSYYYNKLKGVYADISVIDKQSVPMHQLFGDVDNKGEAYKGKVCFSDLYIESKNQSKILNHISIDRFSGGAIDGALFTEEVVYSPDVIINLTIFADMEGVEIELQTAFKMALLDIANGMLPLGGGTSRGHGAFSGKVFINDKELDHEII